MLQLSYPLLLCVYKYKKDSVVNLLSPVSSHRGTELTLLSESVRLGGEDNWCNPRTITDLVTHISSVEDLDEDRTDLLGMSVNINMFL